MRRRGTQEAGIPGIPPVAWRTQPFSRKTEGTHFLMMAFSREDTMPERNFPFSERSGQSVPDPFPPVCPQQTGQNSVFLREMFRSERGNTSIHLNTLTVHEIKKAFANADLTDILFRGGWPELYICPPNRSICVRAGNIVSSRRNQSSGGSEACNLTFVRIT